MMSSIAYTGVICLTVMHVPSRCSYPIIAGYGGSPAGAFSRSCALLASTEAMMPAKIPAGTFCHLPIDSAPTRVKMTPIATPIPMLRIRR